MSHAQRGLLLPWHCRCGECRSGLFRGRAITVALAENYREKARQLRETAASAHSPVLRDELTRLAAQYDNLAANLEKALAPQI